jgi:hypothetical protein
MKPFLAVCLMIISLPLAAAIPLEQAVELCRVEQNALRRLACYDAIEVTTALPKVAQPAAAPQAGTVTTATPAKKPAPEPDAADFGMEHRKTGNDAPAQVYMTVKAVRYSPRKELIVEFDNGQIWRQSNTGNYNIAAGQQHYIKRGVLNAFFLGNDDNNRVIRVRREK